MAILLDDLLDESEIADPAEAPLEIEPGDLPDDEEDVGRFRRIVRRERMSE